MERGLGLYADWSSNPKVGGFSQRVLIVWLKKRTRCSANAAAELLADFPESWELTDIVRHLTMMTECSPRRRGRRGAKKLNQEKLDEGR